MDVLCKRMPFYDASAAVLKCCELFVQGCVNALSIADLVYVLRKELDSQGVALVIEYLSHIAKIVDLRASYLSESISMGFSDYEDGLQAACAVDIKADYIVTRNTKDYKQSPVPAIEPEDFLNIISTHY